MNFLAHLHLAHLAKSSLTGNLLADFIRGDPNGRWTAAVVDGIHMHRRLDSLSDKLPEVREAKQLFTLPTRRVAPIALDVIWDHFLARDWSILHKEIKLSDFCLMAEQSISSDLASTPENFRQLNQLIWSQHWLERYAHAENLENVLRQMAQRRPRLASLAECYHDFVIHYADLEALFYRFYPQLMQRAKENRL
ncbi:ACP phosphodiesterase [Rosenbergiella australiborealis]|uniref:ACP phosphodiesterase n=1 Tax=Rosenbergiella australiborealis TaxID=1544696 RepID=UPI001F4F0651|nr:ACP phosphodiesterase [Rosenbergiella australiborealis]